MSSIGDSAVVIAAGAAALAGAGAIGHGVFAARSTLFGPVISRAPNECRDAVALTFDDGPWPGATDSILDTLGRCQVRATFFVIGRYAARHPALIRRLAAEGHQIGNHTFDHSRASMFRGHAYWRDQIQRTSEAIREITGRAPARFRPPMGFKSPPLMRAARDSGTSVVTWTRRAFDGVSTTPERIVRNLGGARAGEILLLHDGRDPASRRAIGATAEALPILIDRLRERSIRMVTVDDLLASSDAQRIPGI